jgi:type IV secretory pathway TraG/TraD family ATPase VirD4
MSQKSSFPQRTVGGGLVLTSVGYVATNVPDAAAYGWPAMLAGGALAVAPTVRYIRSRHDTNTVIHRWNRANRRHGGTASWLDHLRVTSGWAMRRKAVVLKPSLRELSRWARLRTPLTEYATPVARSGRRIIWSPCEDATLRLGGPGTGKTGELACRIIDAPGAVVATSSKTDIVELTAPSRQARGPLHIFNPGGIGGWASTVKWSPLIGCRVPSIAQTRARDMIPESPSPEGERWDSQARGVLAVLLHAAALGNLSDRAVLAWVSNPDAESRAAVNKALEGSREERTMRLAADQFFGTNERTRTSITTAIMPALRWLMDGAAAAIVDGVDPTEAFNVAEFIAQRGTVYLLSDEGGVAGPLIAAFTAEIARQARAIAATMPNGRLDPALTLALDESYLICPVPLPRWTSDFRSRNITIHISLQGRSQLRERWGDMGAATILNNVATILIYGGVNDADDLTAWSKLSGEREVDVENRDADGKVTGTTPRKEPVISPAQISQLGTGYCMVVRRGMRVCIGKTVMAWQRRDVRRAIKKNPYMPVVETNYGDQPMTDPEDSGK